MSYSSGEAAEQVVRMTLNGVEVAAKISGKAAERLAVLLYQDLLILGNISEIICQKSSLQQLNITTIMTVHSEIR